MTFIRSALFTLVFYSATLAFVLAALVAFPFGSRPFNAIVLAWGRFHRWCAAFFLDIRSRIDGAPPAVPSLVAAKHQSMFETLELMLVLGTPAAVVKRELTDIPLWGWAARRYGVIPIDRAGGATALRRMVAAARAIVADGRSIMIFPEGTRVAPGEQPPLRAGFAGLYRALAMPVVPVAVDSGRLWPRHRFAKHPGIVTLRFGDPIPPGLPRREIEARVHAAINVLEAASGD